jgi:hypothetical protein
MGSHPADHVSSEPLQVSIGKSARVRFGQFVCDLGTPNAEGTSTDGSAMPALEQPAT